MFAKVAWEWRRLAHLLMHSFISLPLVGQNKKKVHCGLWIGGHVVTLSPLNKECLDVAHLIQKLEMGHGQNE
jgi:hypothetical protein